MKKIIFLVVMLIGLTSCGKNEEVKNVETTENQNISVETNSQLIDTTRNLINEVLDLYSKGSTSSLENFEYDLAILQFEDAYTSCKRLKKLDLSPVSPELNSLKNDYANLMMLAIDSNSKLSKAMLKGDSDEALKYSDLTVKYLEEVMPIAEILINYFNVIK